MWERASCKNLYIICDGLIQVCVHADALSCQSKQAVWQEELGSGGRTPTDTALFYPLESVLETAATDITTWKRHELGGNKNKKIQSEVSVHGKFVTKHLLNCYMFACGLVWKDWSVTWTHHSVLSLFSFAALHAGIGLTRLREPWRQSWNWWADPAMPSAARPHDRKKKGEGKEKVL